MARPNTSRIQSQIAAFGKECSKSFEFLGYKGIQFGRPQPIAGQKMLVALNGPGSVSARTDKYTYPAVPFPVSDLKVFWIASAIEFKTNKNVVEPESASVVVFSGEAYNSEKVPLLRAEWESNPKSPHAQPHWHVYTSRIESMSHEPETFESASAFDLSQDISSSINDFVPKFHFAMCANWSTRNPTCVQIIQDEHCVADWIAHTVKYIQGQLRYTMRRHG